MVQAVRRGASLRQVVRQFGVALAAVPTHVAGGVAGVVGPLCGGPSAACSGANRRSTISSPLPGQLASGLASAATRTADRPASQQRARGSPVAGSRRGGRPVVAASLGACGGGPQAAASAFLRVAASCSRATAAGQKGRLDVAASAVQPGTSKCLHLPPKPMAASISPCVFITDPLPIRLPTRCTAGVVISR